MVASWNTTWARYCRPQQPPASGAPADFTQKRGGKGLRTRQPPWQTCWIFNEVEMKEAWSQTSRLKPLDVQIKSTHNSCVANRYISWKKSIENTLSKKELWHTNRWQLWVSLKSRFPPRLAIRGTSGGRVVAGRISYPQVDQTKGHHPTGSTHIQNSKLCVMGIRLVLSPAHIQVPSRIFALESSAEWQAIYRKKSIIHERNLFPGS